MPQPNPPLTYASLCSLFASHLTVAIHCILAARTIYSSTTFLTAKAYNLPVKQSRHPGVCSWINDAVAAVEAELIKGVVRRVVLVIFEGERAVASSSSESAEGRATKSDATTSSAEVTDFPSSSSQGRRGDDKPETEQEPNAKPKPKPEPKPKSQGRNTGSRPLERYIWDVSRFPTIPRSEIDTPFVRRDGDAPAASVSAEGTSAQTEAQAQATTTAAEKAAKRHAEIEKAHADLLEQFRGLLARLSTISDRLKPLPDGCTYTLCVELKDEADPPIGHPQPWIPAERGLQNEVLHGEGTSGNDGRENADDKMDGARRRTKKGEELGGAKTVPVRTVDAGEMVFEMWIEEGKSKFDGS